MVVIAISQARRRSGSPANDRSRIVAKPAGTRTSQSFRKYTSSATSVPMWSMTLNASEVMNESVQPSR